MTIKTPQIIDIGATYNVQDVTTSEAVGALRRKGLKSIFKQHFNPFALKYTMTIIDERPSVDPRLLIAAGILLAGIERRQQ